MATSVFNPDLDPETTSQTGMVNNTVASTTWAAVHDATAGVSVSASPSARIHSSTTTNQFDAIWRGFLLFDTSAIPDTDEIISATLQLYTYQIIDQFTVGARAVGITGSSPASNTSLVTGDFDQVGSVRYATDVPISGMTNNAYNTWVLNAAGLAAISKTLVTKLAVRISSDIDNVAPTWASDKFAAVAFTESPNRPKLTVVHGSGPLTTSSFLALF